MAHIKIDYDGLAQQSSALKNYQSTYENLCTRMRNMSDQVASTWEGSAATAFSKLMQQYQQQGAHISEIIGTIHKQQFSERRSGVCKPDPEFILGGEHYGNIKH